MESSGFFDAVLDSETEEYDRVYVAEQFANYFKLFVGNGVFVSPANQLKVIAGTGLNVVVKAGWAFINGFWYHNDSDYSIALASNSAGSNRVDSIVLRMSQTNRSVNLVSLTGSTEIIRGETTYDIKLAEIIVRPSATSILDADITDTRPNESVCGFVKGLVEVVSTEDLFLQFNSAFNAWFDNVKDQVTGDLAIRLQQEFVELNEDVQEYYEHATEMQQEANDIIEDLAGRDFILVEDRTLTFVNNVCTISDNRITAGTLVDLYFTAASINEAIRCAMYVDSEAGAVKITASRTPTSTIVATIRVRIR